MRRFLLMTLAVVLGATVVGAVGTTAHAQLIGVPVDLPICEDMGPFDLTGDGKVDHDDTWQWCQTYDQHQEECDTGGEGCPAELDVNGDGRVSTEDIWAIDTFIQYCTRIPWRATDPGS